MVVRVRVPNPRPIFKKEIDMTKFKVGDKVMIVRKVQSSLNYTGDWAPSKTSTIGKTGKITLTSITSITSKETFAVVEFDDGQSWWYLSDCFEPYVENVGKKKPHADIIHKWADGAVIQIQTQTGAWEDAVNPAFYAYQKYRVKPTTIDVNILVRGVIGEDRVYFTHHTLNPNITVTCDNETGEVIDVKMIK